MKLRLLIALTALASGTAVSLASELYHPSNAEEGVMWTPVHAKGGLSRAQVEESVLAAQRDGTLTWISRGYPPRYPFVPAPALTKSREQVRQELQEWKRQPVRPDGARLVPGMGWVDSMAP